MANSPILQIPLLSTSQAAKEATINQAIAMLERASNDAIQIDLAGGNFVLPPTDLQRYFSYRMVAPGPTSVFSITPAKRLFVVDNLLNAQPVTVQAGSASQIVPVNGIVILYCDGSNLISVSDSTITGGGGTTPTSFTALTDTPTTYAGSPAYTLKIKEDLSGIEFVLVKLTDGADVDATGITDGQILVWSASASKFIPVDLPTGSSATGVTNVTVATTAEISINDALVPGETIDGIVLAIGNRVLVKDQTSAIDNGIYSITAGAPVRSSDYPIGADFPASTEVLVMGGAVNRFLTFIQIEANGVVGTTPLTFGRYSQTLAGLFDVSVAGITDGQSILYDASSGKFIAFTPSGGGGGGVPAGGTVGQILAKLSNATGDTGWVTLALSSLSDIDVTTPPVNGQALIYDQADAKWKPANLPTAATTRSITANSSVALSDKGGTIIATSGTAIVVTIPEDVGLQTGDVVSLLRNGEGAVSFAPASGVTLNIPVDFLANARYQYSIISIMCTGTNTYVALGALEEDV